MRPAPPEVFNEPERPARFNMGAPAYVRIFKKEGELELWLKVNGRYSLYRTFPICKWSGRLGPKVKEADYQSPEGFYSVSARQLNPHSNYHLAFNVGYPNAFDRQNGHTGGLVMVHGNCKSVGCFAMTDKGIEEIYGFVAAALSAGQREVPVHIFPFHMTDAAIARETGGGGGGGFHVLLRHRRRQWRAMGWFLAQSEGRLRSVPTDRRTADRLCVRRSLCFWRAGRVVQTGRRLVKAGCANRTPPVRALHKPARIRPIFRRVP